MSHFESRLFLALRENALTPWQGYVDHAFVQALGDGSLPRDAFLKYLKQDYLFLIHFARAWALAVVKSDRIDEMRLAAATVHALIDEEMRLHIETCAREGIDEHALATLAEEPENLAYTRFVMDTGLRGDLLDLLTVLAPCVFGYGEIGNRLANRIPADTGDHPYQEWISTYAGSEYQAVCVAVGQFMDKVADRMIGPDFQSAPRWRELNHLFSTACRLETDFWAMGLKPG